MSPFVTLLLECTHCHATITIAEKGGPAGWAVGHEGETSEQYISNLLNFLDNHHSVRLTECIACGR